MFSSYDIARKADVVFSEALSVDQFKQLDKEGVHIIHRTDDIVFYKKRKFTLRENDVIFTHTGNLNNLFYLLKNLNEKMNLTLVTHQSDRMIDEDIFNKKPSCIKKWYALNSDYLNDNLIPLPLGVANEYSYKKNIIKNQLPKELKIDRYEKKENLVYINFTESTNYKERSWIKDYFSSYTWAIVEDSELSIKEYIDKIKKTTFVICPWGNGVDSHRIWETLSLGSIPIVKKHLTFKNLSELPILFVNDFKEINEKMLINYLSDFGKRDFNLDLLTSDYWGDYIKKGIVKGDKKIQVNESNLIFYFYYFQSDLKSRLNNYAKKINYYIRKIKQR
tara:strand:+ start:717 stop:1718 length:1002 start_codon:yes stop_codon:yes gene_type:complete